VGAFGFGGKKYGKIMYDTVHAIMVYAIESIECVMICNDTWFEVSTEPQFHGGNPFHSIHQILWDAQEKVLGDPEIGNFMLLGTAWHCQTPCRSFRSIFLNHFWSIFGLRSLKFTWLFFSR
jgi:hypothetical protein